ncbi:MAG: NYN domain-containing protein [Candidatus Diapherotrites archaeon]|nr:NYN domain-containing protein [Candidatus Diapherotrites archaeon]
MTSKRAMLFIDGNNFYHNLRASNISPSSIDFLKLSEVVCNKFHTSRVKTIYYNSSPSIESGQQAYYDQMRFFGELQNLPKFEVKLRKLQKHSNAEVIRKAHERVDALILCSKCKPIVRAEFAETIKRSKYREKGVDVSIAIDMVALAYSNDYDVCILLSGDADFIPALELVQLLGKEVRSTFLKFGYSTQLRQKFHSNFMYLDKQLLEEHCSKES